MANSDPDRESQLNHYPSGAVRPDASHKPRYDLIPVEPLRRIAESYQRGAERYGEHNWELGMPTSRMLAALMRHIEGYRAGDNSEDHLAHAAFNLLGIMYFQGTEWDDTYAWPERTFPDST